MTVHALAPASTANLGPAFDCAAAALELWNEVVVDESDGGGVEIEGEGAAELPRDASHLTLRAFALFAPRRALPLPLRQPDPARARARLECGGDRARPRRRQRRRRQRGRSRRAARRTPCALEGHADNVAAALLGGVCVAWWNGGDVRAARIADDLPLASVARRPATRTSTAAVAQRPARDGHARRRRRERGLRRAARSRRRLR